MSTGLYTHTTRATGTILTAAIYNADHQNHITNQNPQQTGAYSDNVGQMQTNTNPGGVGSESLPTNVAGEFERLRFQLKAIIGSAQWYSAPAITLQALAGAGVADNSITNAKLADMASPSFKARITAATGDPEDVTVTQATSMLNAMVGDSGSGGTKGLAPAPSAGDAAASKFLKADGAWATPPTGGLVPAAEVRTGSATITIPTGATKLFAILNGGGGGGGGAASGCCAAGGAGGGGGGALLKYLSGLTPGNTLALTIGAGGNGGTNLGGDGTVGGATTLASGSQSITTLTAGGGGLGKGGAAGGSPGGAGGTGTNGDSNHSGTVGGGQSASGNGRGGTSGLGMGHGQAVFVTGANGLPGVGFGGAGSGATPATKVGGAGTAGGAVFFWFP